MKSLKEYLYNDDKTARQAIFSHYFNSQLFYKIEDFVFPVPVSDIGEATFNSVEKAPLMMRYVRKHLDNIEHGKNSN